MVESWEDGGSTETTAYDKWIDTKGCEGIWKCHYPFVVGACKHPNGEAWVVLRCMGPTIAVLWFYRDYYSGTVDRAVKTFTYKEEDIRLAKAKEFGDQLLANPIPEHVAKARAEYVAEQAKNGKKGGQTKAANKAAAKAAPAAPISFAEAQEAQKAELRRLQEGPR